MRLRFLSARDVRAAVGMPEAIDCMREAFGSLSSGDATVPLRLPLETEGGVSLFMPAYLRSDRAAGVKIVSVHPENVTRDLPAIHALVVVTDPATGVPEAVMDGTYLTALRTGAAGGLAAELLAREEASVVALFGAGAQGRTQLEAVRCVRDVEEVRIVDRDPATAQRLARELERVWVRVVDEPGMAVRGAHIVITATTSYAPVFPGSELDAGTHVTAIGSYTPQMQEVDVDTIERATVVVDQREAALAETGDLLCAIADGRFRPEAIHAELGEVVSGARPGRRDGAQITLFKSVGNAAQDVAVARRVLDVALARDLGATVEL